MTRQCSSKPGGGASPQTEVATSQGRENYKQIYTYTEMMTFSREIWSALKNLAFFVQADIIP